MTQSQWMGKLFVFRDDDGEHVSLVAPENWKPPFRAFVCRGPFIPIGLQRTITLPDTERWLDDLLLKGFTCEPCTVDA